ncbi:hypothetical protein FSW04_00655 [Baekduia soli]|uniref:Glycosyltransferase family 1 protein n=1 Tax=Baekduia soli TaxID=496014 RepID=A0A5B8TZS7_9ACTN|nr:hypothetical protein [Baekduia soli]QEC46226.1 hypothetical protein FSW04_00655 [Baekduia soli]
MALRRDLPFGPPAAGVPLRLAFVGQQTYFRACALDEDSARVRTTFVDYRAGRDPGLMRAKLDAFAPHAVVVFRPETVPAGLLADLPAAIVGFLTEPISRQAGPGRAQAVHWDLEGRRRDMAGLDPANVDRIVSFDPMIVPTADEFMEVWRSLPIPVADRLYRPVRRVHGTPRMLFVGRSTVHRERYLIDVKHRFDCLHVAFGIQVEELETLLDRHQITFNIHNEPYPSFENRVFLHLAAGHLVISEPLSPTHGLEPGFDYVEVSHPEDLVAVATEARAFPDAFHRVRVRGRQKAEQVRASRAWPALVRDLFADLAAFGTGRQVPDRRRTLSGAAGA